jgi:hypothetical protein
MLDEATAKNLRSDEMRRLANAILDKRREVRSTNPARRPSFVFVADSMNMRPMVEAWQQSFDPSIYDVALPATQQLYRTSQAEVLNPDWKLINAKLGELSNATISQHKLQYFAWIWSVVRRGFQEVFHYETGGRIALGMAVVVLIATLIARAVAILLPSRRAFYAFVLAAAIGVFSIFNFGAIENLATNTLWVFKGTVMGSLYPLSVAFASLIIATMTFVAHVSSRPLSVPRNGPAFAVCANALLLFAGGILLVSLVEMPLKRYIIAVSSLLPGAILLVTVKILQTVWSRARSLTNSGSSPAQR